MRTAVVVFWLCMTAWLIRYEAFPEYFTQSLAGYRSLLSRDVLVLDSWMKVMFRNTEIGYSHTNMEINESNPVENYLINNRIQLCFKIIGVQNNVNVLTSASLDMTHQLQNFSFSMLSQGHRMSVEGARTEGCTFDVEIKTGSTIERLKIDIPDDVILYAPMTEMAMKHLKPAQQINIRILGPITMKKANVIVRALRKEPLILAGQKHKTTVLAIEYQGMELLTWVDSDGNVLRQEAPFGWTMEKCTPEEAVAALRDSGDSDDILRTMALQFFSRDS